MFKSKMRKSVWESGWLSTLLSLPVWLLFLVFLERRVRYAWVPSSPLIGLAFFLFELLSVSSFIGFLITLLHGRKKLSTPPRPPDDMGIDVVIVTLNEDVALLRRTVRRAIAIRYPHQTWLFDDGNRVEVKALAAELGCSYHSRTNRGQGGKAGNLNAALTVTSAPFVLVLDADALAHETILERTLGYFEEPAMAFVQTPQVFCNVEAFDVNYDPVIIK
jgi:cellulose synthase (UDP-forming)